MKGVDFILGNSVVGDKVMALPCMINSPDGMSDSSVDSDTMSLTHLVLRQKPGPL